MPVVVAVDRFVQEPRRFGEVRDLLQQLIGTDEPPSRQWQVLFRWLAHFQPDRFGYKRPRHSEDHRQADEAVSTTVARHRTAMERTSLSRPVALALGDGVIRDGHSIFDYGCGRGGDLQRLRALGFEAAAGQPAFAPTRRSRLPTS